MKILLTIHHELDPNSGAPGSTYRLGQAYRQLGHEVEYFSFDQLPQSWSEKAKALTFPEFVAGYLLRRSFTDPIDLIDASTGDAWLWAKFLRGQQPTPLLVTRSHGLEHLGHQQLLSEQQQGKLALSWRYRLYHGGFRLWEVAQSLRAGDQVVMLNRQDLAFAVQHLGLDPDRAVISPNGIADHFLHRPLEPLPDDAPIRIAQIGSYIPRKGIQYSSPALNTLLQRYPQIQLSLLGTGCDPTLVYQDFAPEVHSRIQVVPRYSQEELPTLLKGHQIKLLASLSEGFGKVLIEAMACELVPVTTATPGALEIVSDRQDGWVVPLRNQTAIEEALTHLIQNRNYLQTLRQNAYTTAQQYDWLRIAQFRLSIYEQAFQRRSRATSTQFS